MFMPKYYIKTFGCQMNISDSERISAFLEKQGFKLAKKAELADLVVFNTCGVRQAAENRVYGMLHDLRKKRKDAKIILTGCLADRKDVQRRMKKVVDLFIGIKDFTKNFSKKQIGYLSIKPKHTNKFQAYVPIMTGCNNFCSYCVVPYARGREISRLTKDIEKEIGDLAKKKYKEIVLLGQNVNSYKSPKTISPSPKIRRGWHKVPGEVIDFPKLLDFLAKKFPQINFRFLTSHPKDFSQELMNVIAQNKNISRQIHLPIQAGSSKILKAMNRPYTQKHYLDLIKKARKTIPGVSFTTDVIVGFPGETEKDFQQSVKVFRKVKFNEAYINKYSPRPGTAAYGLGDPIPQEEKRRREKILRKML
jgi:tRNA-2-methylthio-N6-dimethylallyladenosine synthase